MARRAAKGQPRKLSPDDARVHRAIDREHAISLQYLQSTGRPAPINHFPAIRRLLESCDEAARRGYKFSAKRFRYAERSFPVELSNLGRVILRHPVTGERIGSTSWFGAW